MLKAKIINLLAIWPVYTAGQIPDISLQKSYNGKFNE